jgi:hypothetical protein
MASRPSRGTVIIDAAWLAARRRGPYILDRPGTAYVLRTDVRTEGTAFVVVAPDVVLDLNGHTVTYNDAPPVEVRNGGFEEGEGRNVPGWDLSGAPAARVADNTRLLFGRRVLHLETFSSTQRLVSDPIELKQAGRGYTASITPANPKARGTLRLTVLDRNGRVLGSGISSSPARGFSAVAHFIPKTPGPVRLQIDVTPKTGLSTTLDLDRATLTVAGDCGVVASRIYTKDLPGWGTLPIQGQEAYKKKKVANFTVKGGKIVQGRCQGHACPPLFFVSLPGVTVEGVETLATGDDTDTLNATGASVQVVVRGCTFREQVKNITHRMHSFATVKVNAVSGPVVIEDNHLLGCPQVGIMLGRNDPQHPVVARRNEIRQDTVVTNGYAIICSALQNFEISDNVIKPSGGKGISFDSYTGDVMGPGVVQGNVVESQERPNREYPTGLEAVGLRLRNIADKGGAHKNLKIHDNVFSARCGPGLVDQAYGGRISYVNRRGEMIGAGVEVVHNTFRAVAGGPKYRARALVLDKLEDKVGLEIRDNILESNDVSLAMGDSGGGAAGATLVSCTLRKKGEGVGRPYTAVQAGYYIREVLGIRLLDTRYEGGATPSIVWAGTGKKEIAFGRLIDVKVVDAGGSPVAGAMVRVLDRQGREVSAGKTGTDGTAPGIALVGEVRRVPAGVRKQAMVERCGPYRVEASEGSRKASATAGNATGRVLTITLR